MQSMTRPIVTVVAWSVCLSVCLLNTTVNSAKTAEPIDLPLGVCTGSHALGWSPNPRGKEAF